MPVSETLLHFGQSQQLPFIRVVTRIRNGFDNCRIIGVFADGASFDEFPTVPRLAAHSRLKCKLFDIVCPGNQAVHFGENVLNFLIGQKRRVCKVIFGKCHVGFRPFAAVGFCFAELTPLAAGELSFTAVGEFGDRFQNLFCPVQKVTFGDGIGADVSSPRLVNGHADGFNIVNPVKQFQSPQGIQLHLRIFFGFDKHTATVFVVNDVKLAVRDDNAVACAESVTHILAVIQPLLNEDNRVAAGLPSLFYGFRDKSGVSGGAVLHFLAVLCQRRNRILGGDAERFLEPKFTKGVCLGALGCKVASFIVVIFAESGRRRAVQPSV